MPERLSKRARAAVETAIEARSLYVSSISVWEVHLLSARGRLALTMDTTEWIARSESLPYLRFVPIDNRIASLAVQLREPLHEDPADRFIVATALTIGARLVSKDRKLLDYPAVRTVW
jgi:PIN domain nuclease of toxin-antitoxin system